MQIDLNSIGKTMFNNRFETDSKLNLSLKELKDINYDIIAEIKNDLAYKFTESNEKTVEFLKTLLLYCYISNINLNNYISINTVEDEKL